MCFQSALHLGFISGKYREASGEPYPPCRVASNDEMEVRWRCMEVGWRWWRCPTQNPRIVLRPVLRKPSGRRKD